MRIFVAIPLPEEFREAFGEIQKELSDMGKLKLVEPENMHMTLKFVGEVSEERKNDVIGALSENLSCEKKIRLEMRNLGVFPSPNYVRVVWIGIGEGRDAIEKLQSDMEDILKTRGFRKEERFHPHVTLARVKWIDKKRLGEFLKRYEDRSFGSFELCSLDVMRSELQRRGPTYSLLKRINVFKG